MDQEGTGSGAYWAETVQRKSRESFQVLFEMTEEDQELDLFLNSHLPELLKKN